MTTTGEVPIEFIRDFLCDQSEKIEGVPLSEAQNRLRDHAFHRGGKDLESIVQKQNYLLNNNLFDPAKYFGGLDVSDLEKTISDERLDDMFKDYLPTEAEENQPGTFFFTFHSNHDI